MPTGRLRQRCCGLNLCTAPAGFSMLLMPCLFKGPHASQSPPQRRPAASLIFDFECSLDRAWKPGWPLYAQVKPRVCSSPYGRYCMFPVKEDRIWNEYKKAEVGAGDLGAVQEGKPAQGSRRAYSLGLASSSHHHHYRHVLKGMSSGYVRPVVEGTPGVRSCWRAQGPAPPPDRSARSSPACLGRPRRLPAHARAPVTHCSLATAACRLRLWQVSSLTAPLVVFLSRRPAAAGHLLDRCVAGRAAPLPCLPASGAREAHASACVRGGRHAVAVHAVAGTSRKTCRGRTRQPARQLLPAQLPCSRGCRPGQGPC